MTRENNMCNFSTCTDWCQYNYNDNLLYIFHVCYILSSSSFILWWWLTWWQWNAKEGRKYEEIQTKSNIHYVPWRKLMFTFIACHLSFFVGKFAEERNEMSSVNVKACSILRIVQTDNWQSIRGNHTIHAHTKIKVSAFYRFSNISCIPCWRAIP